ncbi:MAG: PAM68 family protein [Bryobacteraceae bacterium]|nr:PAM68 family protein [Bryobacteraceae bacterium]
MGKKSRAKREETGVQPESLPVAKPTNRRDNSLVIPKEVSNRTLGRVLLFSGVPIVFAMATYFVAALAARSGYPFPNVAVLLVSLGFFGISVVGITYGYLSASWDPAERGSFTGIQEFKENSARILAALKEEGAERREEKS